jgi:acyl-coenzyme A thioesterase PaaI-like protein
MTCISSIHGFMLGEGGVLHYASVLAPPHTFPSLDADQCTASHSKPENAYPIHIDLFHLGPKLRGVPFTIYGGVLALLADGVLGKTAYMHRNPKKQVVTAYTNIRFVKPLLTDKKGMATTMVKTQISSRGRDGKIIVLAVFEGPGGIVYAEAEGMLVEKEWKTKL